MDTDRAQRKSVNAPGWKWIPLQGVWLWWDGERYSACAVWDGRNWQASQRSDPGWREDPTEPGTFRYWDGLAWTKRARHPASTGARALMSAQVAAGCAVLAWGGYVFGHNPAVNNSLTSPEYYCADENIDLAMNGVRP